MKIRSEIKSSFENFNQILNTSTFFWRNRIRLRNERGLANWFRVSGDHLSDYVKNISFDRVTPRPTLDTLWTGPNQLSNPPADETDTIFRQQCLSYTIIARDRECPQFVHFYRRVRRKRGRGLISSASRPSDRTLRARKAVAARGKVA